MEMMRQGTGAFCGLDCCHILIKCPSGGRESRKEYYNFKNFYPVVLMGLLAKYWFIWASTGLPGSTHGFLIFQTLKLYNRIANDNYLLGVSTKVNDHNIPPIILGDIVQCALETF